LAQNFVSLSVVDQALANLQVAQAQAALSQAQLARMRAIAPFQAALRGSREIGFAVVAMTMT
jgi:membrane fusion protein (multidrug efflux system)